MFRFALSILLAVQALACPMVCQILDGSCCGMGQQLVAHAEHGCDRCDHSNPDSEDPVSDQPANPHHACFCTVAFVGLLPGDARVENIVGTVSPLEFIGALTAPVAQLQRRNFTCNSLYGRVLLANICSLRI